LPNLKYSPRVTAKKRKSWNVRRIYLISSEMEIVTELINKSPDTDTQAQAHGSCSIHKIAGSPPQPKAGQLGSLGSDFFPTLGTSEFSIFQRAS